MDSTSFLHALVCISSVYTESSQRFLCPVLYVLHIVISKMLLFLKKEEWIWCSNLILKTLQACDGGYHHHHPLFFYHHLCWNYWMFAIDFDETRNKSPLSATTTKTYFSFYIHIDKNPFLYWFYYYNNL